MNILDNLKIYNIIKCTYINNINNINKKYTIQQIINLNQ